MSFYIEMPSTKYLEPTRGYVVRSGEFESEEAARRVSTPCNIIAHPPNDREIETHHDGHGLTESIRVTTDGPGPGGASHLYALSVPACPTGGAYGTTHEGDCEAARQVVGFVQFQRGPRNAPDSVPGVVEGAVLAILIDRLEAFQAGPYPSEENAAALDHLKAALAKMKERADKRAARGVLGTNVK